MNDCPVVNPNTSSKLVVTPFSPLLWVSISELCYKSGINHPILVTSALYRDTNKYINTITEYNSLFSDSSATKAQIQPIHKLAVISNHRPVTKQRIKASDSLRGFQKFYSIFSQPFINLCKLKRFLMFIFAYFID